MSWPGTDFEVRIQNRLDALQKVADAARKALELANVDDEIHVSCDEMQELAEALAELEELDDNG